MNVTKRASVVMHEISFGKDDIYILNYTIYIVLLTSKEKQAAIWQTKKLTHKLSSLKVRSNCSLLLQHKD
jgi:hypothetical protein